MKALYGRLADRRTAAIALVVCGVVAVAADSIWRFPLWAWEIAFGVLILITLPLVINDFRIKRAERGRPYVLRRVAVTVAFVSVLVVITFVPRDLGHSLLSVLWLVLIGAVVVGAARNVIHRFRGRS